MSWPIGNHERFFGHEYKSWDGKMCDICTGDAIHKKVLGHMPKLDANKRCVICWPEWTFSYLDYEATGTVTSGFYFTLDA